MAFASQKSAYLKGVKDGAPFLLVVLPFAILFGIIGTEAGLDIAEVMGFSVLVIAGASQFTAVQLMAEGAPMLIVLLASLAVNLRMAMYSASLTPYLGALPLWKRALAAYFLVDQSYLVSVNTYERNPEMPLPARFAYFMGTVTPIAPFWYGGTWAGASLGTALPDWLAIDFAIPLTFIAMIAPALRTLAHVVAALVSVLVALALASLPYSLGLLAAALAAMIAGAQVELWMARRRRSAA